MKKTLLELDSLLLPNEPTLLGFQRRKYTTMERARFRWDEGPRGSSKTYLNSRHLLVTAATVPDRHILFSGPGYRQSLIPYDMCVEMLDRNPLLRGLLAADPTRTNDKALMKFRNGSTVMALPASGDLIRGYRASDILLTEFTRYEKALHESHIWPMAAKKFAGGNTVTWELTAGLTWYYSHTVRERVLKRVEQKNPLWAYSTVSLDDLRDCGFPMDWEIVGEAEQFDPDFYAMNFLNQWVSITGSFYEYAVLMDPILRLGEIVKRARTDKTYSVGIDIGRSPQGKGDDTAITVFELSEDRPPTWAFSLRWNNMAASQQAAEIVPLLDRFRPSIVVLDTQGYGQAVYEEINKSGYHIVEEEEGRPLLSPPHGVIVKPPYGSNDQNALHGSLRAAFNGGPDVIRLPCHPGDRDPLNPVDSELLRSFENIDLGLKQLADLMTKPTRTGSNVTFEAPPGRKKDVAYSGLYAWHGVRLLRQKPPEDEFDWDAWHADHIGLPKPD